VNPSLEARARHPWRATVAGIPDAPREAAT